MKQFIIFVLSCFNAPIPAKLIKRLDGNTEPSFNFSFNAPIPAKLIKRNVLASRVAEAREFQCSYTCKID